MTNRHPTLWTACLFAGVPFAFLAGGLMAGLVLVLNRQPIAGLEIFLCGGIQALRATEKARREYWAWIDGENHHERLNIGQLHKPEQGRLK